MKPLKEFQYYLEKQIVKKKSPDLLRAKDLIKSAQNSYQSIQEIIEKIGMNENNINQIITSSYDIILELIRAIMNREGYSAAGFGAHEAEVSYLKELNFLEDEIIFTNQLRSFRNNVTYYGKQLDKEYAKKTLKFLDTIYKKLRSKLEEEN
jgi:hypothetical protein